MSKEALQSWDGHDSERWHTIARKGLHLAETIPYGLDVLEKFADQGERFEDERLLVIAGGIEFENPFMIGAGWDKVGEALAALNRLGFSGTEVGTVTPLAQPGNEKPRQWMIAPGVSLNRLGFNSPGADAVVKNLERYQRNGQETGVVGISIGKNKNTTPENTPNDYFIATQKLYDFADYFAINVSSPNTQDLRSHQQRGPLTDIVHATISAMNERGGVKPVFVKIAPDNLTAEDINDIIRVIIDNSLAGIIATNTTTSPELKAKYGQMWREEAGGLAGNDPDFREMSTKIVRHIFRETNGEIGIIGVGGVNNTASALDKIRNGAKVVQVVTGFRGRLPLHKAVIEQNRLPGKVNRGIIEWMDQQGVKNISDVVGQDVR